MLLTTSSPNETHRTPGPAEAVSARRLWIARVWLAACLTVAAVTASLGYFSPQAPALKETRIDQMQVGAWVLAGNPTGEKDLKFGTEVDQRTWRKLTLTASKKDGSTAAVTLLRPLAWLDEQGAKVGGTIEISVPECGIDGLATIHTIDPCPTIKPRPGPDFQVVTATFKHQAAKVIDLYVEGLREPIGTTPNHLFWSETHSEYLSAIQLSPGDDVLTTLGNRSVEKIQPRDGRVDVYNLEVAVFHTFFVGNDGVLVHNSTPVNAQGYWNYFLTNELGEVYYVGRAGPNETPGTVQSRHARNNDRFRGGIDNFNQVPGSRSFAAARMMEQDLMDTHGTHIGRGTGSVRGNVDRAISESTMHIYYECYR